MLRAVHEALALSALAAIAVHVLALLLDPWLTAGPLDVLVPFSMPYRPLATGLGQIAALGILVLGPTFYLRTRLGAGRWKSAHRFIAGFWLLALVHGVAAGTDGADRLVPALDVAGGPPGGRAPRAALVGQ